MQIESIIETKNIIAGMVTMADISFNISGENAQYDREIIENKLAIPIISMSQKHTSDITEITPENIELFSYFTQNKQRPECDGLITKMKNIAISSICADCASLYFYAPDIEYVGIVHSGWKGTFSGIIENAVKMLKGKGGSVEKIIVFISPTIKQENYEVDKDFYDNFIKKDQNSKPFFISKGNKYLYDNAGYILFKLKTAGINTANITVDHRNTYSDDGLFSYRAFMQGHKKDGRMLCFIGIKDN